MNRWISGVEEMQYLQWHFLLQFLIHLGLLQRQWLRGLVVRVAAGEVIFDATTILLAAGIFLGVLTKLENVGSSTETEEAVDHLSSDISDVVIGDAEPWPCRFTAKEDQYQDEMTMK